MSEAERWLAVCEARLPYGRRQIVTNRWCRRLLSEVAGPDHVITMIDEYWPAPVGGDGNIWRFSDGSSILANSATAIVR